MKKLMMMVAACAAMVMGAKAYSLVEPNPNAPSITAVWMDGDATNILCVMSSPDLGGFAGRDDEHYIVEFGFRDPDHGYYYDARTMGFFEPGAHTIEIETSNRKTVFNLDYINSYCNYGKIKVSRLGDHGVDAATSYQIAEIGTLFKDEDGVWNWRGANGTSGVIGTSAPVDDDEPTVEPEDEDEQKQTKCPVLSFFRKLFGKR